MQYTEGQIVVLFKDKVTEAQAMQLVTSLGLSTADKRNWRGLLVIKVPKGEELQWVGEFKKQAIVKIAELSHIYQLA
ncbi:hypothetical protein A2662_01920 [Candidatus Giovannonibacteria bacterium RIFCSPHIGHO2_01_FULL_45_33]|uniref:Fervidolysin-like N-terminal prodomain domain-containing protein n=1 Tax=Candidatus Giovannonibacteria bacterium RIFCSPLOWO2_01_FULL_45_34 TaxID=1798351 RepID=A0A1F5WZH7_9BACT|nr:MAG: hypothetical protein A2662_01920 [Candidatus Giovannonibacteria bacterium RIFCSPHIGHO2_01_FULL_45_33]OGF69036.1 MAG: hypothetical protein A3C73_00730 [Candidatus Giovannonibacteria bacterium RIFCSPHIGHO2_02_FULL_44_11]OGF81048.1 MAG: hypothetical protein A2930_03260 [Candidatus Giovannonibacteria bacterium RIFCSPLOWO2_01_FULL_45_34]